MNTTNCKPPWCSCIWIWINNCTHVPTSSRKSSQKTGIYSRERTNSRNACVFQMKCSNPYSMGVVFKRTHTSGQVQVNENDYIRQLHGWIDYINRFLCLHTDIKYLKNDATKHKRNEQIACWQWTYLNVKTFKTENSSNVQHSLFL